MSVRIIKKTIKSQETSEIFNQMLGAGSLNLAICYPKYDNICKYIKSVIKILEVFYNCSFIQHFPDIEISLDSYRTFLVRANEEAVRIFSHTLMEDEWKNGNITEENKKKFTDIYNEAKDSFMIHTCIKICDNLVPYRHSLKVSEGETPSDKFIVNLPGMDFCPLPFTDMNFKLIMINITKKPEYASEKKLIMLVLQKLFLQTYALFTQYSKPDIDLDEFAKIITDNMKEAKKRIPRCDKAFKIIENSVNMLKENFNDYYKDFIQSRNQSVIMENFISDVAKNTSADTETRRQFMEIIKHYKKMSESVRNTKQGQNVEKLFAAVESKFNNFGDMQNLNQVRKIDDDSSDESDDESSEEEDVPVEAPVDTRSISEIMSDLGIGGKPKNKK